MHAIQVADDISVGASSKIRVVTLGPGMTDQSDLPAGLNEGVRTSSSAITEPARALG